MERIPHNSKNLDTRINESSLNLFKTSNKEVYKKRPETKSKTLKSIYIKSLSKRNRALSESETRKKESQKIFFQDTK